MSWKVSDSELLAKSNIVDTYFLRPKAAAFEWALRTKQRRLQKIQLGVQLLREDLGKDGFNIRLQELWGVMRSGSLKGREQTAVFDEVSKGHLVAQIT